MSTLVDTPEPTRLDSAAQSLLRMALDPGEPGAAVIGWPGQPLREPPRQGDLLLRQGLSGEPRLMRVEDPALAGAPAFARAGRLTEHGLPGRYVTVIDHPGAGTIGRRLLGPDGLVVADTCLLRVAAPGETALPPLPPARPMIRQGSSGPAVAEAQGLLNRIDEQRAANGLGRVERCPLTIDARFGPNTRGATVSFQRVAFPGQPNEWDGIIGPRTWAMLDLHARGDTPIVPPDIPPVPPFPPIIPVVFRVPNPPRWGPLLAGLPTAPLRTQNAVRALIDGPQAYLTMLGDLRTANNPRSFIYLLGWDCHDNFPLDPAAAAPCDTSLNHVLADCVAGGAQVRAMIWRNIFELGAMADVVRRLNAMSGSLGNGGAILDSRHGGAGSIDPATLRAILDGMAAAISPITLLPGIGDQVHRVTAQLARDIEAAARAMLAGHHQKILIIFNGERLIAYCGGIDFNPNRSTTGTNCIPGSTFQQIAPSDPQHDTHCRIVGPAASDLLKTFVDRWLDHPDHNAIDAAKGGLRGNPVSGVPSPPVPNPSSTDAPFGGSTSVIIARTYNPPAGGGIARQRDVRTLLQRAVANAQSFIYFEDQYLWDFDTPSGGVLAMAAALNRALPRLNHITAVIPANAVSAPSLFQRFWRIRFINEVRRGHPAQIANRFRVFQLNRGACTDDGCLGRHTYVHSKCWVIDDELAVIGSANCNRRGYQHDSEADAFIFDETAPSGPGPGPILTAMRDSELSPSGLTFAQQFRMALWREHLGMTVADGADNSAWPVTATPVGNVVPLKTDRPVFINPTVDGIAAPIIDAIAESARPIFDPASP